MKHIISLLILVGSSVSICVAGPLALYNFNNRLKAPCPYPKELAEKKEAAPYQPNAEQGETGPPLIHKYSKYGSRTWYDPREQGGVLHMKFNHAWIFDQFHTEKPLFADNENFRVALIFATQFSYGKKSLICSVGGIRLQIVDYKHLTGKFHLSVDDGGQCVRSGLLDSDTYYNVTFGRRSSNGIFLEVDGNQCSPSSPLKKTKSEDIPNELWIGGANDIKIALIEIDHPNRDKESSHD